MIPYDEARQGVRDGKYAYKIFFQLVYLDGLSAVEAAKRIGKATQELWAEVMAFVKTNKAVSIMHTNFTDVGRSWENLFRIRVEIIFERE